MGESCKRDGIADLERFVSEENIARFRKLLDASLDERQRRTIVDLLTAQIAALRKH